LATSIQAFFVPKTISDLRFCKLPLSVPLSAALKRLRVETFGDLSGMTISDFRRISNKSAALFVELTGLTQRARDGEFTAAFGQNVGISNSSGSRTFHANAPIEVVAKIDRDVSPLSIPLLQVPTDERIFIPQEARGRAISTFQVSVRLRHIFEYKQFCILGDIHGISYAEFRGFRNCGKKTVSELRELVRMIQREHPIGHIDGIPKDFFKPFAALVGDCLTVPVGVQDLNLCDLPLSVRLENVLKERKATRLGDLNGVAISELKGIRNCGKKTISEIVRLIETAAAGEFKTITEANVGWSPVDLASLLDTLILELSAREVEILELRLSGEKEQLPTLEEMGAKFKLTRERIRQIVNKITAQLRRAGSRRLNTYLLHVAKICRETVCPLTPELFEQWLGEKARLLQFSPGFYARLLCELNPAIPAWHGRQEASARKENHDSTVETALNSLLRIRFQSLTLSEAFSQTKAKIRNLDVSNFFDLLRHSRQFRVEFLRPDRPMVKLARFLATDIARIVLQASDSPLTPEEIFAQARANFGQDIPRWSPQTLGNALNEEKGFYLLGPRTYGLDQHFTLPKAIWRRAKTDFEKLLTREGRPVSTPDVVRNQEFDWLNQTNSYEIACILRADNRFIDFGKFLFALTEWGIQEREYVKDLIPKILEQAGKPLTGNEVLARLQQLRSVSPYAISGHLRKHPQVRDYGFGYYGLKSWGESVHINIVTDPLLIERAIRRAEPPLKFSRLCEILNLPVEGNLVDKLWQTCAVIPAILRLPDECASVTRLIHKACRLERALVATAREVNRPLPLYEFQWELNERFGPLFAMKTLDDLRRCLEHNPLFLRNANDEFILDIHLEQLGLDAAAIRAACYELLSQTNEIVGCEDLLERLEADGKVWEDLSTDILASLLRDDATFQEVGHDRFRAKVCKH
jgi:hypothetical protein